MVFIYVVCVKLKWRLEHKIKAGYAEPVLKFDASEVIFA